MAGPPPPIQRRKAPPPAVCSAPPPTDTPAPSPRRPVVRDTWYVPPSDPVHMASAISGSRISTRCGLHEVEGIEWTGFSNRVTCPECAVLPGVIHDTSVCPCSALIATPELMERMLAGRKI